MHTGMDMYFRAEPDYSGEQEGIGHISEAPSGLAKLAKRY